MNFFEDLNKQKIAAIYEYGVLNFKIFVDLSNRVGSVVIALTFHQCDLATIKMYFMRWTTTECSLGRDVAHSGRLRMQCLSVSA